VRQLPPALDTPWTLSRRDIALLLASTVGCRHAVRDRCLLLLMFRHGLRVSEACRLTLAHVDVPHRVLHVIRLQHGLATTQPLRTDERQAIQAWLRERTVMQPETDAFFVSERRRALSRKTVWLLLRRCGVRAGLPGATHPQMLRHACGFALAAQGADTRVIQAYLGHRRIAHTLKYTAGQPVEFAQLWQEGEPKAQSL
jgi:site-specific recombinase XerD